MKEKFYITTPIYYPSNKFTLGNCYTTVICDTIAKFNKKLGKDVFFLTGTDEHGQKISLSAQKAGKTEKEYLDEMIADAKKLWQMLDINYSKFIRTTDDYHEKAVQKIFNALYEKGYIYQGERIINWDPVQRTALSNIEVIHKEIEGHMYYFKYFDNFKLYN